MMFFIIATLAVLQLAIATDKTLDRTTLRLSPHPNAISGRLEVFHNGQWGSICDDHIGPNEATVACRTLGFQVRGVAFSAGWFGAGTGPIWLDDVNCTGIEPQLGMCGHRPWGDNNCDHNTDVGVACCPEGSRLVSCNICDRGAVCADFPDADCWPNYCDRCTADFYVNEQLVDCGPSTGTHPELVSLSDNGRCYIRKKACTIAVIEGNNLIKGVTKCRSVEYVMGRRGRLTATGNVYESPLQIRRGKYRCKLMQPDQDIYPCILQSPLVVKLFKISVVNDNARSNELDFIPYDKKCIRCRNSDPPKCSKRGGRVCVKMGDEPCGQPV